jgi:hypothetical protein
MKIKQADYDKLKAALDTFIETVGIATIRAHKAKRLGKDIDMRFRWDLLNGSGFLNICQLNYLNDSHIDTALKHYVAGRKDING